MKYRCSNGVWISAWKIQFIKQVEPKLSRPRKPIVVNALPCTTYRRRGYWSSASILLLVVIHGLHETLLFKFLSNIHHEQTNEWELTKKKTQIFESLGIHITWPLFANVSVPLHSIPDRIQNLCMHDNKSFHSIIPERYYVAWSLNDRLCAGPYIRKIYNVNRNKAVVQNRHMCSIGTI